MISSYKRKNVDQDSYSSTEPKKEKLSCVQVNTDDNGEVQKVIRTEFSSEINRKENEISIIEERLKIVQKTLHLLRYVVVTSFYNRKPGLLADESGVEQRENSYLPCEQFKLHPAIKKIVGGNNVRFEPLRTRRKVSRATTKHEEKSESLNTVKSEPPAENSTDTSIRPNTDSTTESGDISCSSHVPNTSGSCTVKHEPFLSSSSRNERYKSKHCIIVGNISKWNPPDNKVDKSTYKWMVYVRGPKENPDISSFVKKIRFFLHPSYQPNDVVEIGYPPFHLVRRGWGEFPLRVQVHFHNKLNKPVDIIHTLKLDQSCSGLQTLGAETIVEIWIYTEVPSLSQSAPIANTRTKSISEPQDCEKDFEKHENKSIDDRTEPCIPDELFDDSNTVHDSKENSHSTKSEKLNNHVVSVKNANNKYNLDKPNLCDSKINLKDNNVSNDTLNIKSLNHCKSTDRLLDNLKSNRSCHANTFSNLQKKIISSDNRILVLKKNNTRSLLKPRNQISLLKNNIRNNVSKSSSDNYVSSKVLIIARSIEDMHNYCQILKKPEPDTFFSVDSELKTFESDSKRYDIEFPDHRFKRVTTALNYLLRRLPVITDLANDTSYLKLYPYTASTLEQYLSWNSVKKFYSEWYRAKVIKGILNRTNFPGCEDWSIKSIIKYSQSHGYSYYKSVSTKQQSAKTIPQNTSLETNLTNSLTFSPKLLEIIEYPKCSLNRRRAVSHDETEIDILNDGPEQNNKQHQSNDLQNIKYMIVEDESTTLHRQYIKDTSEKLGVKLIPEEITVGVWYSASETVILTAIRCLAEDLIRKSLHSCIANTGVPNEVKIRDVQEALTKRPEFDLFLNHGLGKE